MITVFIPMYNAEEYIYETVSSVLKQKYENFELIIIDDGSNDNSMEIVKSIKDNRIKLYQNEKNMGLPYTRNRGLELSSGKYIALLDADDICKPNRLDSELVFLENHPEYGAVCSNTDFIIDNKIIKSRHLNKRVETVNLLLMFGCFIANPSAMIRREIINKHKLKYNEKYFVSQDYGFWVELSKYALIAKLPDALVIYRKGHNNITKTSITSKALERKKITDEIRTNCIKHNSENLTDDDIHIINTVFSDPPVSIEQDDLFKLRNVINKILVNLDVKNKKDIANKIKFLYGDKVLHQNIKLSEKVKLLAYKFNEEEIQSIISSYFMLYIRTLVRMLKSKLKRNDPNEIL